ncbi:MAG: L,D-transpeptidase family protein [Verrucomicrobiales bacterium]|nr:L,D-transpeptidase family protein [Verrucomicrobiales bacterium]
MMKILIKKISYSTLLGVLAVAMTSCHVNKNGNLSLGRKRRAAAVKVAAPVAPQHYIYKNEKVLAAMTSANAKLKIDLSEQRVKLYSGDELALESQISTGTEGHRTPTGKFEILEKKVDKKSNRYGKWVHGDTGATLVSNGDSYKRPNGNAKFRGTAMPYWMRVTWRGVGMHIGYVPLYAASHGCIRVPREVQPLIFAKTRVGTPVEIVH